MVNMDWINQLKKRDVIVHERNEKYKVTVEQVHKEFIVVSNERNVIYTISKKNLKFFKKPITPILNKDKIKFQEIYEIVTLSKDGDIWTVDIFFNKDEYDYEVWRLSGLRPMNLLEFTTYYI